MRNIVFTLSLISLAGCNQIQGLRTSISALPPEVGGDVEERALQSALSAAYTKCETDAKSPAEGNSDRATSKISPAGGEKKRRVCVQYKENIGKLRVGDSLFYDNDGRLAVRDEKDKTSLPDSREHVEKIIAFANAGMTLSDLYCDRFFREANLSSRKRRFTRGLSNDVGGAIATAMGLAKVASGIVGGVAGGFAFADSSFRNYDESFMVDADLSKMRRLVLSAQDNMKLEIRKAPPEAIFGAESKIIRYAGLCSFLGMKDLLNESVAEKTVKIEKTNEALKGTGTPPVTPPTDAAAASAPPVKGGGNNGRGANAAGATPNANTAPPVAPTPDISTTPPPVAPQASPG